MCVVQTVNRLITKTSLVVSMNRESFVCLLMPRCPAMTPSSVCEGQGWARKEGLHLALVTWPGEALVCVLAQQCLCPSGFARIPLPNHFLSDGHMHIPNCMVLFELA